MKTTIKLPLSPNAKVVVEVGDKIERNTKLATGVSDSGENLIHLARLLHVDSSSIPKYLRKRIGQEVSSGDLLAQKKGFFSLHTVTSPVVGKISEVDLKKGTLTILSSENSSDFVSPTSGKVVKIDQNHIDIEIEGQVFKGAKGEGEDSFGNLVSIAGENIGILDISIDVDDCIVLAHSLKKEAVVKLDVMGAAGLVLLSSLKESSLAWVQVDQEAFKKIKDKISQYGWLRPKERQIVVID